MAFMVNRSRLKARQAPRPAGLAQRMREETNAKPDKRYDDDTDDDRVHICFCLSLHLLDAGLCGELRVALLTQLSTERLRKGRLLHTANAACIWSYRRIIQEGLFNVARAWVASFHAVAHPRKKEEETP